MFFSRDLAKSLQIHEDRKTRNRRAPLEYLITSSRVLDRCRGRESRISPRPPRGPWKFGNFQASKLVERSTLPETNSEFTPENRPFTPIGNVIVFQPSIFRGVSGR